MAKLSKDQSDEVLKAKISERLKLLTEHSVIAFQLAFLYYKQMQICQMYLHIFLLFLCSKNHKRN